VSERARNKAKGGARWAADAAPQHSASLACSFTHPAPHRGASEKSPAGPHPARQSDPDTRRARVVRREK
jgi:hypothetical protein